MSSHLIVHILTKHRIREALVSATFLNVTIKHPTETVRGPVSLVPSWRRRVLWEDPEAVHHHSKEAEDCGYSQPVSALLFIQSKTQVQGMFTAITGAS